MRNTTINALLVGLSIGGFTSANASDVNKNLTLNTQLSDNAKFIYTLNNKNGEYIGLIYQIDSVNGSLHFKSQQSFKLSHQELSSLNIAPDGKHAYLLSSDQIYAYDIDQTTGELTRNTNFDIYDDSGNIVNFSAIKFHTNGKYIYTVSYHRLIGKINIAVWELQNGKYALVNTISDNIKRNSTKLDINLSNDNRYLYISTRVDSQMLSYQISDDGKSINYLNSTKIDKPILWSFTLDQTNNHLFTFNSNNEVVNMGEYVQTGNTLQNIKNTQLSVLSYLQEPLFSSDSHFIYGLGCNNYDGHGALYNINPETLALSLISSGGILSCFNAKFNIDRQGSYLYLYADEASQLRSFSINKQNGSISAINQLDVPKDVITKSISIKN